MSTGQNAEYDVAVVGARLVGASCALWLTTRGQKVILIDKNEPGSGTSFGNACSIATYACIPINSPKLFRQLPSLLIAKDSPLKFDWSYALRNLPWLFSFLRNCSPRRVQHITSALSNLLQHVNDGFDPLLDAADAQDLIAGNGFLNLYSTQSAYDNAWSANQTRRQNGAEFDVLEADQIRELEPNVKFQPYRGLYYKNVRQVRDPQQLTGRYASAVTSAGGTYCRATVTTLNDSPEGVTVSLGDGKTVSARKCVIAAGAHSRSISGAGIQQMPLDTERGYHIQYSQHAKLVSRPVGWVEAGFYATPTLGGLRFAGTVEIAGLNKPPSAESIAMLKRTSRQMFDGLGEPEHEQDWIGFRPTMPDSSPVIGLSPRSANVLFAFGHQHIGLTLSGITGKIISDLILTGSTDIDISAYSPNRFTS